MIKDHRYCTLTQAYAIDEIDKLEDWIKMIALKNKVMKGFNEHIQKMKDQTEE